MIAPEMRRCHGWNIRSLFSMSLSFGSLVHNNEPIDVYLMYFSYNVLNIKLIPMNVRIDRPIRTFTGDIIRWHLHFVVIPFFSQVEYV